MKTDIASDQKLDLSEDDLIKMRQKMFEAGLAPYSTEVNSLFDELVREFTEYLCKNI